MTITLGSIALDERRTAVREKHEEIAGRTVRTVTLTMLVENEPTPAALEARLDAIVAAAPPDDYVPLSLRPGRRLHVRRIAVSRDIARDSRMAALELKLESRDDTEEAVTPRVDVWLTNVSGAERALVTDGNAPSHPRITILANDDLVDPGISDGVRTLTYHGALAAGQALIIDGEASTASLDGDDVMPYSSGLFPRISPPATTLVFVDGLASSHNAAITVEYRDRWM